MKRSTAVRHLREMAEEATQRLQFGAWPLAELWVSGSFLDHGATVDAGAVLLRLDLPEEQLPWLSLHPAGEAVGEGLRLGKRPFSWWYRSVQDPPWTIEHQRVARFWSDSTGTDDGAVESLGSDDVRALDVVRPTEEEFALQIQRDLSRSRAHLRSVVSGYWEREWRLEHRPPEDHLHRAAAGLCALEDAHWEGPARY